MSRPNNQHGLKREFNPELRSKRYAHRGARPEEVAQRSGRGTQLVEAGNRLRGVIIGTHTPDELHRFSVSAAS